MAYKNPTLLELVAELRFEPGTLTHQRLFDIAGTIRPLGQNQVEFPESTGVTFVAGMDGTLRPSGPKLLCWNSERTRLVQLQESVIAVNHIGLYQGWDGFFGLFKSVHEAVRQNAPDTKLESLALTAVDKLIVPKGDFKLGKYLNCGGPFIPGNLSDCETACDLTMGRGMLVVDDRNSVIVVAVRINESNVTIQFNTILQAKISADSSVEYLLEDLHQQSNDRFECLITDETRAFMGGEK